MMNMIEKNKRIINLLLIFILLTCANIAILNPNDFSGHKEISNNDDFSDDISHLNINQGSPFRVGVGGNPTTIDPINSWDSRSNNVINQVCEGLFAYNLSDHSLPRLNWLAEDYWWEDTTTLQIKLREGVVFHDSTPFNAIAAEWNLNRLLYLTNCTGTLSSTALLASTNTLWKFPNGTAIINQVNVVSEYNITLHLNGAYAPLLELLSYTNAYMLSPASTPVDDYIDLTTGDLIGTGPFEYDGIVPGVEIDFHAFDFYWQGKANITEMKYIIMSDPAARNNAMLDHDIDFLDGHLNSYIPMFEADPLTTVEYFTDNYDIASLLYYYIGFNNELINITMRKAMSYAIDYSYIIEVMQSGEVYRANSPISPGFADAFNSSTIAATWNLAKARQIMKDAGIPGTAGLTANNDTTGSIADAWKTSEFASYNFSYNAGSAFSTDLSYQLAEWFDQIGITLVDVPLTWGEFIDKIYNYKHQLSLFYLGWGPDYCEPLTMLDPLFSPTSNSNAAQVNDLKLTNMLEDAIEETDTTARHNIYKRIQGYVATQLFPHAFVYHPKINYVYSANLTNFPHNALQNLYFYPCIWTSEEPQPPQPPPPSEPTIFINDLDPNYNWSKTASENDWCTGSGTWSDPYIIRDIEIDGESIYSGIEIHNSSVYFNIENCTLYNCTDGIRLLNTNNSLIYNNSIYDSRPTYGVIYLEFSNNNSISLNNIWNITFDMFGYASGIFLMYSNDCNINHNTINEAYVGIMSGYNSGTMIDYNNVSNTFGGIVTGLALNTTIKNNYLFNNTYGILLQETNETIVKENQAIENEIYGIYLWGSTIGCHDNTIIQNQIYDNSLYGVILNEWTSHNLVYRNYFVGNGVNAQDNGTLNEWDDGAMGNYWDDYLGFDLNDDGIGDSPYLIDGIASSMDNYPIFDDGPDDITSPIITINDPINGMLFGASPPEYDIDITEDNLDTAWYTIDDGANSITIIAYTGTLDESAWNALPDGAVTITFYANDTAGNIGSAQVTVYKDTVTPVIVINDPNNGDEFTTNAPIYDIDITEPNLDTVWYTMDGGVNNITITEYTGTVDNDLWNALPNGAVTITFYANDTVGNIGSEVVVVNKNPGIPGANPVLIILILGLGVIGLSWRNKRKLKY